MMILRSTVCATALFLGAMLPGAAAAESLLGRTEYAASCAQCHGPSGRGDGPIADLLTTEPPDLTGLARDNGGVFPFARLYAVIENGGGVGAHGAAEMPAWGDRFVVDSYLRDGVRVPAADQPAFVRDRILALLDHIAGLQQD
jgi:mono/diheme cytochrome c family protein